MTIRTKGRTAALSYDSLTYVEPEKQIRCRGDWMVVEPLDIAHSAVILVLSRDKPMRGLVKAIGPGHHPATYFDEFGRRLPRGDQRKSRVAKGTSPHFESTTVQAWNIVTFGGPGYWGNFHTFLWGGKIHILLREEDVTGVFEDESEVVRIVPQYTLSAPYSIPGITQSDIDALIGAGLL